MAVSPHGNRQGDIRSDSLTSFEVKTSADCVATVRSVLVTGVVLNLLRFDEHHAAHSICGNAATQWRCPNREG